MLRLLLLYSVTYVSIHTQCSSLSPSGFEQFESNSFEQLCINLANEHLQQQFNKTVLKQEQDVYIEEGIDWQFVDFDDNVETLGLLEGSQYRDGVFSTIDEQCRLINSNDQSLAASIRSKFSEKPKFRTPKLPTTGFVIEHYAGEVLYDTDTGMLSKNKDFVSIEHSKLALPSRCNSDLVQKLLAPGAEVSNDGSSNNTSRRSSASFRFSSCSSRFRTQLSDLMKILNATQPFYIRCIRPNTDMLPDKFDYFMVNDQLRCGGVLEATRIASAGFPTRRAYSNILTRYCIILRQSISAAMVEQMEYKSKITMTCKILDASDVREYKIGRTKVFLKSGSLARLEASRGRARLHAIITIQGLVRGFLARREASRRKAAIQTIQRSWRRALQRKRAQEKRKSYFAKANKSAGIIQHFWKASQKRRALKEKHRQIDAKKKEKEDADRARSIENVVQQPVLLRETVQAPIKLSIFPEQIRQRSSLFQEMLFSISPVNILDITQDSILELAGACSRDKMDLIQELRTNLTIPSNPLMFQELVALNDRLTLILALYDRKLQALDNLPPAPPPVSRRGSNYVPRPLQPPPGF